jgi:hypothetical protein
MFFPFFQYSLDLHHLLISSPVARITSAALRHTIEEMSRRHHSTTAAVLKVTEDIRSNIEDGQVTVFVFLDFSRAIDIWAVIL